MILALGLAQLLAQGPVEVPHLGFFVDVVAGEPVVTAVEPNGIAEKAGLRGGMVLVQETAPWPGALAYRTVEDVVASLTVPPMELVLLTVRDGTTERSITMVRMEPIPSPEFPTLPLPESEVKKLPPAQLDRYRDALHPRKIDRPLRKPSANVQLPGNLGAIAWFDPKTSKLLSVYGGGATPKSIAATLWLNVDCGESPVLGVDVAGNAPGLPVSVAAPPGPGAKEMHVARPLLLWSVKDAASACAAGTLASPPLTLTLRCKAGPVKLAPVTVPLKVTCGGAPIGVAGALLSETRPSVDPPRLVIGGPTTLSTRLSIAGLVPCPAKLTPVILDDGDRVVSRLPPVPLADGAGADELKLEIKMPVQKAGVLRVAFEASYVDGSSARSDAAAVIVETREAKESRDRAFATGGPSYELFSKKLQKTGLVCGDPKALLAWLKAQPEVASAAEIDGDVSYVLTAYPVSTIVHCHEGGY